MVKIGKVLQDYSLFNQNIKENYSQHSVTPKLQFYSQKCRNAFWFQYLAFRKKGFLWVLCFLENRVLHFALIHSITELNFDVLVLTSASC